MGSRLSRKAGQGVFISLRLAPPLESGGGLQNSMYYMYLLLSGKDNNFYIGYSEDLKQRFTQHTNGLVEATKYRRPLKLVYYEAYISQKQALEREQKLKQFGSSYAGLLKRLGYK
jgi:putative endonuclease